MFLSLKPLLARDIPNYSSLKTLSLALIPFFFTFTFLLVVWRALVCSSLLPVLPLCLGIGPCRGPLHSLTVPRLPWVFPPSVAYGLIFLKSFCCTFLAIHPIAFRIKLKVLSMLHLMLQKILPFIPYLPLLIFPIHFVHLYTFLYTCFSCLFSGAHSDKLFLHSDSSIHLWDTKIAVPPNIIIVQKKPFSNSPQGLSWPVTYLVLLFPVFFLPSNAFLWAFLSLFGIDCCDVQQILYVYNSCYSGVCQKAHWG